MNAILRYFVLSISLTLVSAGCSSKSGPTATDAGNVKPTSSDYLAGKNEAQRDIQSGRLIVKTYGLPQPWSGLYSSNLLSRYQVTLRYVAGCDVNEKLAQNVQGYNEVAAAEINQRYGADLLNRVAKESARQYEDSFTNR